ncbi:MAG: hypothetical protein EOP48_04350 [Sphingobacteriales bacterium]|nr:MAG: hypothetical protein EOP48_04350 [Sphingobacteriales bacterium]
MKTAASIGLLLFLFATSPVNAQLKNIDKRVESKVKRKVDQKADRAIDKALDKAEKKIDKEVSEVANKNAGNKNENRGDKNESASDRDKRAGDKNKTAGDINEGASNKNEGAADTNKSARNKNNGAGDENKTAGDNNESTGTPTAETQQSDFIPGEKIIFYDDFAKDAKADFPAKWNTNGSGEIVLINGTEGKWLKIPDNTTSFPEINKTLPDNFTIEFDLYYPTGATRPPVTFGFTEVKNPAKETIKHKKIFYFRITPSVGDNIGYSTSLYSGRETTQPWPANTMAGKVIHVSMAVNKQRIRLYVDENKIFDLPKAFEPNVLRNNFHFRAAELLPKPQDGFYVSNLRIAESGQDARSQLLNKGSFSTTGIYFNTGSSVIKPTSHNTLKMIADIIKENPGIRKKLEKYLILQNHCN